MPTCRPEAETHHGDGTAFLAALAEYRQEPSKNPPSAHPPVDALGFPDIDASLANTFRLLTTDARYEEPAAACTWLRELIDKRQRHRAILGTSKHLDAPSIAHEQDRYDRWAAVLQGWHNALNCPLPFRGKAA